MYLRGADIKWIDNTYSYSYCGFDQFCDVVEYEVSEMRVEMIVDEKVLPKGGLGKITGGARAPFKAALS